MLSKRLSAGCVLAFAIASLVPVLRAEVVEQILVKVNGDIFTKTELEQRQVQLLRTRNLTDANKPDLNDETLKKAIVEVTPDIVLNAVDDLLLLQRGKELGYKLTDDDFKRVLDNIKKENKIENEEQFQAALKQESLTMPELRKNLEKTMIVQRLMANEVSAKIAVTEDEARQYYETHKNEFTTPSAITLREILLTVPNDGKTLNVGVDEDVKAQAEALRARLEKGEEFEKLVTEMSAAPSKANGGLIGPINRNELTTELQKLLEPLKVGGVTPVVRTPRGYQIFKLESSSETKVMPFDEAREQIADKVAGQKQQGEFQKYLEKLRSQAIIEWKNEEVKKAYDLALARANQAAKGGAGSGR